MAALALIMLFCMEGLAEDAEALADRAGFNALADYAAESDFDAWNVLRTLLRGDAGSPVEIAQSTLNRLRSQLKQAIVSLLRGILPPIVLCVGLREMLGRNRAALGVTNLLCTLCCAVPLETSMALARQTVERFLFTMNQTAETLTPVLVSVTTLTGATASASIITPLSAECAELINLVLGRIGLELCMAACGIAVAGSLSIRFPLYRLFNLVRSAVKWLLGGALFLFGAMMSARGMLGAARDSVALQTAQLALENLVPVIGGEVSNSAGSLAASVGLVRYAVGFTGVAFIAHSCLAPMIELAAGMGSMKLITAVLEPLALDAPAVMLISHFSEVMELLLAICACAAMMSMLLAGGCAALAPV